MFDDLFPTFRRQETCCTNEELRIPTNWTIIFMAHSQLPYHSYRREVYGSQLITSSPLRLGDFFAQNCKGKIKFSIRIAGVCIVVRTQFAPRACFRLRCSKYEETRVDVTICHPLSQARIRDVTENPLNLLKAAWTAKVSRYSGMAQAAGTGFNLLPVPCQHSAVGTRTLIGRFALLQLPLRTVHIFSR